MLRLAASQVGTAKHEFANFTSGLIDVTCASPPPLPPSPPPPPPPPSPPPPTDLAFKVRVLGVGAANSGSIAVNFSTHLTTLLGVPLNPGGQVAIEVRTAQDAAKVRARDAGSSVTNASSNQEEDTLLVIKISRNLATSERISRAILRQAANELACYVANTSTVGRSPQVLADADLLQAIDPTYGIVSVDADGEEHEVLACDAVAEALYSATVAYVAEPNLATAVALVHATTTARSDADAVDGSLATLLAAEGGEGLCAAPGAQMLVDAHDLNSSSIAVICDAINFAAASSAAAACTTMTTLSMAMLSVDNDLPTVRAARHGLRGSYALIEWSDSAATYPTTQAAALRERCPAQATAFCEDQGVECAGGLISSQRRHVPTADAATPCGAVLTSAAQACEEELRSELHLMVVSPSPSPPPPPSPPPCPPPSPPPLVVYRSSSQDNPVYKSCDYALCSGPIISHQVVLAVPVAGGITEYEEDSSLLLLVTTLADATGAQYGDVTLTVLQVNSGECTLEFSIDVNFQGQADAFVEELRPEVSTPARASAFLGVEVLQTPTVRTVEVGTASTSLPQESTWWASLQSIFSSLDTAVQVTTAGSNSSETTDDELVSIWSAVSDEHLMWLFPVLGFVLLICMCAWWVTATRKAKDDLP